MGRKYRLPRTGRLLCNDASSFLDEIDDDIYNDDDYSLNDDTSHCASETPSHDYPPVAQVTRRFLNSIT